MDDRLKLKLKKEWKRSLYLLGFLLIFLFSIGIKLSFHTTLSSTNFQNSHSFDEIIENIQ